MSGAGQPVDDGDPDPGGLRRDGEDDAEPEGVRLSQGRVEDARIVVGCLWRGKADDAGRRVDSGHREETGGGGGVGQVMVGLGWELAGVEEPDACRGLVVGGEGARGAHGGAGRAWQAGDAHDIVGGDGSGP